jgi:hypothetical protein
MLRSVAMELVCTSDDCASDIAALIARSNVVQVKDAIPLREAVGYSADAVDYFLWRQLPAGAGSVLCNVSGAALGDVVDVNLALLRSLCFGRPGAIVREYFRRACGIEDFIVPVRGIYVRVLAGPDAPAAGGPQAHVSVPYHQDAYVLPPHWKIITCWTLLHPDRAGEDAPGLEFICGDFKEVLDRETSPTHPTMGWIEASTAQIGALLASHGSWIPRLQIGDAMLFNQYAPHRTHVGRWRRPRLAAEVRMIAKEPTVIEEYARNGLPYFTVGADEISGPRRARIGRPIEFLAD